MSVPHLPLDGVSQLAHDRVHALVLLARAAAARAAGGERAHVALPRLLVLLQLRLPALDEPRLSVEEGANLQANREIAREMVSYCQLLPASGERRSATA